MKIFIRVLKILVDLPKRERFRGTGWLNCPNCKEYTSQNVVDQINFISIFGYRLTPINRSRYLRCNNCDFARPAIQTEILQLKVDGKHLQRAVLFPFGALSLVIVFGMLFWVGSLPNSQTTSTQLDFVSRNLGNVAPMQWSIPASWNFEPNTENIPPSIKVSQTENTASIYFTLRRFTNTVDLPALIAQHYQDESSFNNQCFPSTPPRPTATNVANFPALKATFDYLSGTGDKNQIIMFAFDHERVGYTLTYVGLAGKDNPTLDRVIAKVNASIVFIGKENGNDYTTANAAPSLSPSSGETATSC